MNSLLAVYSTLVHSCPTYHHGVIVTRVVNLTIFPPIAMLFQINTSCSGLQDMHLLETEKGIPMEFQILISEW